MPVESQVFRDGECLLVAVEAGGILIARFNQNAEGAPISTLEHFLAINDAVVTLTEAGQTYESAGATFAAHDFVVCRIERDPFLARAPAAAVGSADLAPGRPG